MDLAVQNPIVDALTRLPILDAAQRDELARLQAEFPKPRSLAKELVRRDWLTPYQANQIFLGHADDLVLGHYVCLNKIGEGGMGHVFKARQRPLDRIVALKVLRRECMDNAKTMQRFQREIRAVGQLRHPNIVCAHDADQSDGLHFIAMECIEGVDLARMVKRNGPIAIDAALDFIRQAALGLQHAHENGLVHRDIKPGNLLVANDGAQSRSPSPRSRFGTVKILDLGLARVSTPGEASLTVQGTLMGTPDFIAPEQAINPHGCDARADLYALGCTLYYLIAGRIPFPRGGVTEKLMQHQIEAPEPLADVRRARLTHESAKTGKRIPDAFYDVPPVAAAIVTKLMAKRPDDRFQSAAEVAWAIERLQTQDLDDPMTITPTPLLTRENLTLDYLPAPPTMPMSEFLRPPSWQSMVKSSSEVIVDVALPKRDRRLTTRWWVVCAACTLLISGLIWLQRTASEPPHRVRAETQSKR